MEELEDDFKQFHDEIIFENMVLKSKVEALEGFVKSLATVLLSTPNYDQLMKEAVLKETETFDDLSRRKQVYDAQAVQDMKRDYLLVQRMRILKYK